MLAGVPTREDPRDAIVGRRLADLAQGAKVGTSSLRRAAQLRKLRPDLAIESVRGNLDTRLRKLDEGRYDAIVLAAAGLKRLGWGERIAELLAPEVMCPAVGQGALALESRAERAREGRVRGARPPGYTRGRYGGTRRARGVGRRMPGAHRGLRDGGRRAAAAVGRCGFAGWYRNWCAPNRKGPFPKPRPWACAMGAELLERGARRILDAVYAG